MPRAGYAPQSIVSVLTVTARSRGLERLRQALIEQILPDGWTLEWVIVDAVVRQQVVSAPFRVRHVPAPRSWVRSKGYRFLASARNRSLLLAGEKDPERVLCAPMDDDCLPRGRYYLRNLITPWARRDELTVPAISYDGGEPTVWPNGNALMVFPLALALEHNGYSELLDANWPGTPTFEDVDLVLRMRTRGALVVASTQVIADHQTLPGDYATPLQGIKCNHVLRALGAFEGWSINGGPPTQNVQKALTSCPYLHHEQCAFLGRRCEIPLELARFGHPDLAAFLASRPMLNMAYMWRKWAKKRGC